MSNLIRHTALLLGLCWASALHAQPDALTRDFEKLSAKERARIAKEEQAAAQNDAAYQAIMAEAEQLFQRAQYDASLEKYQAARTMRPYNVYPKVKIQDLQALIAKRDAAATAAVAAPIAEPVAAEPVEPGPVPVFVEPVRPSAGLVIGPKPGKTTPMVVDLPVAKPATVAPPPPAPYVPEPRKIVKHEPVPPPDLEESERVYKEGRSVVVERRIALEGHIVVFRKVSHPWGEVNYFRDGIAVSARVYDQAMAGR